MVKPVPMAEEDANSWGGGKHLAPALSTGKSASASTCWSADLDAAKAVDDNPETRWGAAPGSRSGWLAIDLGKDERIGRIEIMEQSFPRTEEFTVEYQVGDTWKELARGTTIGEMKPIDFPPLTARHVRLNILKASEVPTINEFRILPARTK